MIYNASKVFGHTLACPVGAVVGLNTTSIGAANSIATFHRDRKLEPLKCNLPLRSDLVNVDDVVRLSNGDLCGVLREAETFHCVAGLTILQNQN